MFGNFVGIQYRKIATGGGWEEKDQAGIWEKGEASRNSQKNVLTLSISPRSFYFHALL